MKSNCSTLLRRTLGVAGFLIGFGLLSAGVASADDDSPGLLDGVTSLLAPVTDPVLESLQPLTAPVLTPVVHTVRDVPVVPRLAEPLVAQPSAPADVPPVPEAPAAPAAPAAPVAPAPVVAQEVHPVAQPDRAAVVTEAPQQQQISAPDVAPAPPAPYEPSPEVPFALPGTTGSAFSSGSASPVLADLPARQGVHPHSQVLVVVSNDWIHGSWCYYYGRSHPS